MLVYGEQLGAALVDAIGAQQALGVARVLAGQGVGQLQHMQGAQGDVGQIADGRGHHVEGAGRVVLVAGCIGGSGQQGRGGSRHMDLEGKVRRVTTRERGLAAEDRALQHLQAQGLHPSALPLGVDIDLWLKGGAQTFDGFPNTRGGKMDAETCGLAEALKHPNVTLLRNADAVIAEMGSPWPYTQPAWVFSHRTLPTIPGADIQYVQGDIRQHHAQMCLLAGGKNVWIAGGGELAAQFYDAGLLDEMIIQIGSVTLGSGRPVFPRQVLSPAFTLKSVQQMGEGMVELRYEVHSANNS